jgi:uncharacterized protein
MSKVVKGNTIPQVDVNAKGEISLQNGKVTYGSWSSSSLTGKIRMVQHIAGRSSAKGINEELVEALKKADLPKDSYQTTTIVNIKDAIFGTSPIVCMTVEMGKKEFPWTSVVIDAKGTVQKAWGLEKESSAVTVLDQNGNVLFFRDGKLLEGEVKEVVNLIEESLAEALA